MLPDFYNLKRDVTPRLWEYLDQRVQHHLGPLAKIRKMVYHEGEKRELTRATGETEELNMHRLGGELSFSAEEYPALTLNDVARKLDLLAQDIARQQSQRVIETVDKAANAVGNSVNARGNRFSAEMFLELFQKIWIDFDLQGRPEMPDIVFSPTLMQALPQVMEEIEREPGLRREFMMMIEDKREEWRAREVDRELVG